MAKVCSVGINDLPLGSCEYRLRNGDRRKHKFYQAWRDILNRCYSPKVLSKRPSYDGCEICDEWVKLSSFKEWYDSNYVEGWAIDKDLLVEGNKIYSPKTCRFIPIQLNSMFTGSSSSKSLLPIGVYKSKYGKYISQIRINKKLTYLGTFNNIEDASDEYMKAKKAYVLSLLSKYLEMGVCQELIESVSRRVEKWGEKVV